MARYLRMERCQRCGSSDANAQYDDGSTYCFSCRAYTPPTGRVTIQPKASSTGIGRYSYTLPQEATSWLKKYGLTNEETSAYVWSDYYDLCYPLGSGSFVCRGFGKKWKYLIRGEKHYPVFHQGEGRIVLTEDVVSAIKVSRVVTAMPLLGCITNQEHIDIAKQYGSIILWLDPNKRKEAIQQVLRWRQQGVDITPIFSEVDPKELTTKLIQEKLR